MRKNWSGKLDLNQRPLASKASALTILSYTQLIINLADTAVTAASAVTMHRAVLLIQAPITQDMRVGNPAYIQWPSDSILHINYYAVLV